MVSTRTSNKLKRARKNQKPEGFIAIDESGSENDSIDWDGLMEEDSTSSKSKQKVTAAPKAKRTPTAVEKGKAPVHHLSMKRKGIAKRSKRICGIDIPEQVPVEDEFVPASKDRVKAFENRECIGERHVNIRALRERSFEFGMLIDQVNLSPICEFAESTGFCLQLVRTFYSNAQQIRENEGGPMHFVTLVRNKKMIITPQLIGEVIGMPSSLVGAQYLKGCTANNVDWQRVVDGICMPETRPTVHSVLSKELRQEYHFLNYIVCYNILPNLQSKVLRWDRMAFLYLLGHPFEAHGLNINIPYIIWSRMTKYIDSNRSSERLPFPMIIMRILRKLDVDTSSTSLFYSQGQISDSTVAKSLFTRPSEAQPSPSSRRTQQQAFEDDVPATSILGELQRLASEQVKLSRKQEQMVEQIDVISGSLVDITKRIKAVQKMLKKISGQMGYPVSEGSDSE